jgi:lysozyme
MSRPQLVASLARWQALKERRYRLWRSRVRRMKKGDPRRAQAYRSYQHAAEMVRSRKTAISRLAITSCDQDGVDFIIEEEGIRPWPYLDTRGFATVFVGRLLGYRGITAADIRKYGTKEHPKFTKDEAVALFRREDLPIYEAAVRKALKGAKAKITQAMFNACVSLCFNIGTGGFAKSTVVEELQAGHIQAAANAFLMWDTPPVLRPRRERERTLFLSGAA